MISPDRIAVMLPNWVGDAVMATPALRALRNRHAKARIAFVGRPAAMEALAGAGLCDEELPLTPEDGLFGAVRLLKGRRFGLAVILPNSFRSALLAWLGGAKRRLGYRRDARGWLLTDSLPPPRDERGRLRVYPAIDYYLDLVRLVGVEADSRKMSLAVREEDAKSAADLLAQKRFDPSRPLVMLNPGAAYGSSKMWYPDRFAAVADALTDRDGAQIVIHAAPSEQLAAAQVEVAMKRLPLVNFARREGSVGLLKGLLRHCRLLITTDTGARHIAASLGRPVVTLFGSTDPGWTVIDHPLERIVRVAVPCSPCQKKDCPLPRGPEHHRCMTAITPEMVLAAAEGLLDRWGAGN